MKRILVTGAGGSAGINFIECLRMAKEQFYIVGCDINYWHLALPDVDKKYLIKAFYQDGYLEDLNEIIAKERIELVHSQPDWEVEYLSDNRERVNAMLYLPSKKAIKICHDKFNTNDLLRKKGISVPYSRRVNKIMDLNILLNDIQEHSKNKVVWLRAIRGAGSKAALPVTSVRQAREWIYYWRSNNRLETKDFMMAEFLPGKEYAFQSLWKDGEIVTSQARERLEYIFGNLTPSGQTSSPSVAKTVHRSDVNESATKAVLTVAPKATGIFCVDMKENKEGIPCVTEINIGRFFTTSNFFAKAGCNMPWYYIKMAYEEEIPILKKYNPIPENYYWIRLMDKGPVLLRGEKWEHEII